MLRGLFQKRDRRGRTQGEDNERHLGSTNLQVLKIIVYIIITELLGDKQMKYT